MKSIFDLIEDETNNALDQEKFSVTRLKDIVNERQATSFVWESDDVGFEPLAVDMQTANVCVKVLEAVKEETREIITSKIESCRGEFGLFVEKAWKCVSR
jgi:hypothetical protein